MANLAPALQDTLRFEGGYANVSGDSGGETYRGISRNNFPNCGVWPIIDRLKSQGHLSNNQIIGGADGDSLNDLIEDFYRTEFWNAIKGDDIVSQSVAGYLFDWSVLSGKIGATKKVQGILGVATDGQFGNQTLQAINSADPQTLWNQMVATRVKSAQDIVASKPSQQKFLKGWLSRYQGFQFNG